MPGYDDMNNTSKEALDSIKGAAKKTGKVASTGAKNLVRGIGHKAFGFAARGVAATAKAIASLAAKVLAVLGPASLIIFLVLMLLAGCFVFVLDERGSNESNNLDPEYQNPSYVESTSGITKAIAMTEPQAVIDAYYKYMSTSSYIKSYGNNTWSFQNPEETGDFAGLRDYNKIEENFYLSDDFIRTMDEMLHAEELYYPEQVIKPVYGQQISLKDENGKVGEYYTSRLPYDTVDGEFMLSDSDSSNPDDVHVKDFAKMLADGEVLNVNGLSGSDAQVLPQSQVPSAVTNSAGDTHYNLVDRDVIHGDSVATETGLWDYGFGSVLQYQPEEKISYIECTYDTVDVDFDYRTLVGSTWVRYHGYVATMEVSGSLEDFMNRCSQICENRSSLDTVWSYNLPTNIEAIFNDNTAWKMRNEPNSAQERTYANAYGTAVTNSHINMKITSAWDSDIDQIEFADPALSDYQNVGGGLYPINIALVSHAATFSGNIHYTIIPAGEDGCIEEITELSVNSTAEIDHREPVQTIRVDGGCSQAVLTAHRTGRVITQRPRVTETTSPWGFEYMQSYAEYYTGYIPDDCKEDRDFFVRSGLAAPADSTEKEQYSRNLSFLLDLGLLRLYTGNVQLGSVGSIDSSTLSDSTSDLYILSHVIAAEAGPNKLDELMVGATFVNRVASSSFPDTFWGVFTAPGQYACYTDGGYDRANPTESEIASAIQVLSGQFTIPENIVGQSAAVQGTLYMTVVNGAGFYTHHYCTMGNQTISTVDRYGRPALDAEQAKSLAASLENATAEQASTNSNSLDYSTIAFIGDSLTVGLDNAEGLSDKGALVIARESRNISQAKNACEESAELDSSIKTVYLLIGTNSVGLSNSSFQNQYEDLISTIESKTNGARIIITSLPPVIDGRSNATNAHIEAKNEILNAIASSHGYRLLNIHAALVKDGQLNISYSADGLHLNNEGYAVWFSKIKAGLTSSSLNSDASTAFMQTDGYGNTLYSDYTLYDISNFDVLTATNMQAKLTQPNSGFIAILQNFWQGIVDAVEKIQKFFDGFAEIFSGPSSTSCVRFATPYNGYDVKSVVYHSIAFSNQVWFSTAETTATEFEEKGDGLTFLFVGKNSLLGLSSIYDSGFSMVPGVGTTVEGMISPTDTYYTTKTPYSPATGFMEISTPASTSILAIADGRVIDVNTDTANARGKYVTISTTLNGDTYEVTYGYLSSISVSVSRSVMQGDQIGLSGCKPDGSAALYLAVTKNGEPINPASIFYQPTSVSAGLGGNLNNPDGTVNEALIAALSQQLTAYVEAGGGKYHTTPLNRLQYKQCTWWAFGRGWQYLESIGSGVTISEYRSAIRGNGGDYAANNAAAGLFNYGSTPRANSLVCYPGSAGQYGHVAYVEAVDYVNQVYYESEAGSGNWWGGINKRKFGYASRGTSGQYGQGIFIYLDEPR